MKNYGAGVIGFGLGIATMWGLAIWKERASQVTLPAGTPYLFQGQTFAVEIDTPSGSLPIGSTFVLGTHQYSVQPDQTVEVT